MRDYGGFGAAPKFPHAPALARLLRDWHASARDDAPDLQALYMATLTPDAHGGRRPVRPARRRLLPLLGRRALGDPAFREDAVRQRAAAGGVRRGGGRDRRAAVRRHRRAYRGLAAARAARWCCRPRRRRPVLEPGRRLGRPRRALLRLGSRGGASRRSRRRNGAVFAPRFGLDGAANFEDQWHLCVRSSLDAIAAAQQLSVRPGARSAAGRAEQADAAARPAGAPGLR